MGEAATRAFACLALLVTDLGLAATLAALVGYWQLGSRASAWAVIQRLRLHGWLAMGTALSVGGHLLGLVTQVLSLSDEGQSPAAVATKLLVATHYGRAWLAALFGLAFLGAALRGDALRARWSTAVGWCGVAVFAWAHAWASHAAQQEGASLQVAAQAIHLITVSTWLGAIVAASQASLPTRADPAADRTDAAAWVLRLSTAATAALVVLTMTGALRAWNSLASWSALLSTEYGRLLTAKLVFVAGAAALGGINRFFVLPGLVRMLTNPEIAALDPAVSFRRILVAESVLLLCALSMATLLATSDVQANG